MFGPGLKNSNFQFLENRCNVWKTKIPWFSIRSQNTKKKIKAFLDLSSFIPFSRLFFLIPFLFNLIWALNKCNINYFNYQKNDFDNIYKIKPNDLIVFSELFQIDPKRINEEITNNNKKNQQDLISWPVIMEDINRLVIVSISILIAFNNNMRTIA